MIILSGEFQSIRLVFNKDIHNDTEKITVLEFKGQNETFLTISRLLGHLFLTFMV